MITGKKRYHSNETIHDKIIKKARIDSVECVMVKTDKLYIPYLKLICVFLMYNRIILKRNKLVTTYNEFVCFTNFIPVVIIWSYRNFAFHFKKQMKIQSNLFM